MGLTRIRNLEERAFCLGNGGIGNRLFERHAGNRREPCHSVRARRVHRALGAPGLFAARFWALLLT